IGTLTTTDPGVVIPNNVVSYGTIPALGTSNGLTTFLISLPNVFACGTPFHFTLHVSSSQGLVDLPVTIYSGVPSGPGTQITYTRNSVNLPIPDDNPRGVFDTMNIVDDFIIDDLNLRINDLTHTFTGDLIG